MKYFLILMMFITVEAYAGIDKDLDHYFQGLGYTSNTTNPAAYHGQQAGYYTGGSISMRNKVRDVQLVQISLPSYRSGCGGIDIYGGSISILNKDEIKNTLKNIMSNSVNYATTLALETVSPMILKNLEYWKDYIDMVNRMSINSCEMAEGLVGGIWSKMRGEQQRNCQDYSTAGVNRYGSWAEARQACKDDKESRVINQGARNDSRYADLVLDEGNIIWKAIQKRAFLRDDKQLAEMFMTLSGTIVLTKGAGGSIQKRPFPALAHQREIINALLNGSKATVYTCDEKVDCLHPSQTEITISSQSAFKNRVSHVLDSISKHVVTDTALTEQEKSLIASTSIPILQLITVSGAYLKGSGLPNTETYAEVIAADILYQYLQESLEIIKTSLSALPLTQELIVSLEHNIENSLSSLREKQSELHRKIDVTIQLIQQSQQIERMLIGEFSTELASSISWAKGLK